MARRFLSIAVLVGLAALVAGAWFRWQEARGLVILEIVETDNRALVAWPEVSKKRLFRLEPSPAGGDAGPVLTGPIPGLTLLGARALVLWEVENEDILIYQRLIPLRRLPAAIPISGELTWYGALEETSLPKGAARLLPDTEPLPPSGIINLIDNRARVLGGDLLVLGLGPDGSLELSYGGYGFALAPGGAWGEARRRGTGGEDVIAPADDWAGRLTEALESGDAVTKVTLVNHGRWYPNRSEDQRYANLTQVR